MRSTPGDAPVGFGDKIKHVIKMNYRGLFGFFVPFFVLIWQGERGNHAKTIQCMWIWMAWTCLLQPVHLPVVGIIPVFVIPMTGIISSPSICLNYMNESIMLFVIGSMVNMLLNNSGFDRRIELSILRSGDNSAYNPKKLVFKSATAAFVMSIFSNKLLVVNDVITFLAPTLLELKGTPGADYDKLRAIVCTAIHVGAGLGCNVFPHGSMTILYMRSMFYGSPKKKFDYPDVFNYMQYIIFAFPVSLVMFILSTVFFMILAGGKTLPPNALAKIGSALNKHKEAVPKNLTLHEKETIFSLAVFLILCITRWCKFMNMGWATFAKEEEFPLVPRVRDATVCSIAVLLLFSIPKGYGWVKYLTAKKYKDLPPPKPESGILFWRYVDKKVLYGYLFLFGSGTAISQACMVKPKGFDSLANIMTNNVGKIVTDQPWPVSTLIICFISVFLANIMPGIAAATIWTPFIVNMARTGAPRNWESKVYLGLLASGFGCSFGFMTPFLYTTAYFTHYVGKTPKVKMAKTAFGAVIICFIILWLSITFVAPAFWDPNDDGGFVTIPGPTEPTTTAAGGGGGGGDAPPPPPPAPE